MLTAAGTPKETVSLKKEIFVESVPRTYFFGGGRVSHSQYMEIPRLGGESEL